MRTALCGVGFASLLFVVAAEVLAAGPSPEDLRAARELFASAEKDEDAGKWSDALDKLGRVAQVRSTSGVRYHIALCEEHLGRLAHALDDYVQAEIQARNDGAQDVLRLVGGRVGQLKDRVPRLPTPRSTSTGTPSRGRSGAHPCRSTPAATRCARRQPDTSASARRSRWRNATTWSWRSSCPRRGRFPRPHPPPPTRARRRRPVTPPLLLPDPREPLPSSSPREPSRSRREASEPS
jgi:hypothetical protein